MGVRTAPACASDCSNHWRPSLRWPCTCQNRCKAELDIRLADGLGCLPGAATGTARDSTEELLPLAAQPTEAPANVGTERLLSRGELSCAPPEHAATLEEPAQQCPWREDHDASR